MAWSCPAMMAGHDPDARTIFDRLWQFSRAHPSAIQIDGRASNLMAWEVPTGEGDSDSAFDGDCDIAYALLLADRQLGGGGGTDYVTKAKDVLKDILLKTVGPDSLLPLLGDWVEPVGGVVLQKISIYTRY